MADISKTEKAEATGVTPESSSEETEKVHDLLSDENDPDAGKSEEERAAIVSIIRPNKESFLTKMY